MRKFTFTYPEPRLVIYDEEGQATLSTNAPVERLRAAFGWANPNIPEHRGWAFQAIVDITDLPDWIEEGGETGHRSSVGSDGVSRPMKLVPVTEVK